MMTADFRQCGKMACVRDRLKMLVKTVQRFVIAHFTTCFCKVSAQQPAAGGVSEPKLEMFASKWI